MAGPCKDDVLLNIMHSPLEVYKRHPKREFEGLYLDNQSLQPVEMFHGLTSYVSLEGQLMAQQKMNEILIKPFHNAIASFLHGFPFKWTLEYSF